MKEKQVSRHDPVPVSVGTPDVKPRKQSKLDWCVEYLSTHPDVGNLSGRELEAQIEPRVSYRTWNDAKKAVGNWEK